MSPNNVSNLLIGGIYFIFVIFLAFFSLFGVYTLIRYGSSRSLAFIISGAYAILFIKILYESYQTLMSLLS